MATSLAWAYCWVKSRKMLPMTGTVLTMEPAKPTMDRAVQLVHSVLLQGDPQPAGRHPDEDPAAHRHPQGLDRAGRPVVLMKGEKAKEVRAGVKVLIMTEQMPNTPPRMPPARGPKRMAPRITGMWTVVALVMGRGIMPRGVLARQHDDGGHHAPRRPAIWCLSCGFSYSITSCCRSSQEDAAQF